MYSLLASLVVSLKLECFISDSMYGRARAGLLDLLCFYKQRDKVKTDTSRWEEGHRMLTDTSEKITRR